MEAAGADGLIDRYLKALFDGESGAAAEIVQEALLLCGCDRLYKDFFVPALSAVGDLWCLGEINIAQEHLATESMLSHLEQLRRAIRPKQSLSIRAVIASVEGDLHAIGARIASDLFYFDGWQVSFLGASTPTGDLVEFVRDRRSEVVGLSATLEASQAVAENAARLLKALPHQPLVIGGGQAFKGARAADSAVDLLALEATEAVAETRAALGLEAPEWNLENYLQTLGRRVQSLRKARGWSQRELASVAGLDRTYVSSVEHGKQNLTLSVALKLADALSVPLEGLLSEAFLQGVSRGKDFLV